MRASGLAALSLLSASPLGAQETGDVTGPMRDTLRVSWTDLSIRCVTPARNPYSVPARRSSCEVQSVTPLGSGEGHDWYAVRYLRELIVQDTAWADTLPIDELLLARRRPRAAEAQVALRWESDRRMVFLDALRMATRAGETLLSLRTCLNGTGGCAEDYYRLSGGTWRPVAQAFITDLQARLPAGHQLHKGRSLDLATGVGVWPVATDDDANCCPSFEIPFAVRLDGDTLRLVSAGPLRPAPDP